MSGFSPGIGDGAAMNETFTTAAAADIDALVALVQQFYAHERIAFDEARVRAALAALIDAPALGCVWLIGRGAAVVGYLVVTFGFSLEYGGRDAFIDELFLLEAERGQGLGSLALAFTADHCRAHGVRALHLEVDRLNTGAQRLYQRRGFSDHDRYLMTRPLGD